MKNWLIILLIACTSCKTLFVKKTKKLSKIMTLKIEHRGGTNGAGVAWHAGQQKYYTAITGNTYFPMFVYDAEGKRLGDTTMNTMFDVRGLWYNTSSGTLQTNGFKNFGIAEYLLDNEGMPESVKKLALASRQPDSQSVGAFDTGSKVLYFYERNSGNVIRQNFSGSSDTVKLYLGIRKKRKTKGHKNSTVTGKYNETTCIYSGISKAEIGLLNAKEKQIELYNPETGLLKRMLTLPSDAPVEPILNFSCSNGIYWLFDKRKREWRGYQ
jgi:hypothetical protein